MRTRRPPRTQRHAGKHGSSEKAALLMVHFGTTRRHAHTIDAINAQAQAAFPEPAFRRSIHRASSSAASRNVESKRTRLWTLLSSARNSRQSVHESTNIIDEVEMESLRRDVETVLPFFGNAGRHSLLYSVECRKVVEILGRHASSLAEKYLRALRSCRPRHLHSPPLTAR